MKIRFYLLCLLLLPGLCFGNGKVLIIPELPPLWVNDNSGIYDRVVAEIIKRSGTDVDIVHYPLARAVASFLKNENACYPASEKIARDHLGGIFIDAGIAINPFKVVIASDVTKPAYTSPGQLQGESIAFLLGDPVELYGFSPSTHKILQVNSIEQAIRLVEAGRADAMVVAVTDLVGFPNRVVYDADNPIYSTYDSITCHPGENSRKFLTRIHDAIYSMRSDGSLKSLLGEYYLPE